MVNSKNTMIYGGIAVGVAAIAVRMIYATANQENYFLKLYF